MCPFVCGAICNCACSCVPSQLHCESRAPPSAAHQAALPFCAQQTRAFSCPSQIARSTEARPKKLHYVSPAVRDLLRVDVREQLKIIGAGVKTWERQDDKV